jgi:hypothetical protein
MNEHISAMKFILWAGVIALALSGTVSLSKATYRMAEAAVEAQTKNQLSYGKYSRMLWSGHELKGKKSR